MKVFTRVQYFLLLFLLQRSCTGCSYKCLLFVHLVLMCSVRSAILHQNCALILVGDVLGTRQMWCLLSEASL